MCVPASPFHGAAVRRSPIHVVSNSNSSIFEAVWFEINPSSTMQIWTINNIVQVLFQPLGIFVEHHCRVRRTVQFFFQFAQVGQNICLWWRPWIRCYHSVIANSGHLLAILHFIIAILSICTDITHTIDQYCSVSFFSGDDSSDDKIGHCWRWRICIADLYTVTHSTIHFSEHFV